MAAAKTRREIMQEQFFPASPYPRHLGMALESIETDHAVLTMSWDERLTTFADIVHGGAIASLVDTAGMCATWSDETVPESVSGATATMTVSYVAAARGKDLTADARVVRRGRTMCFSEIVVGEPDGRVVARGSVLQVMN